MKFLPHHCPCRSILAVRDALLLANCCQSSCCPPRIDQAGRRTIQGGGITINIQTIKPGLVLLHLEGTLQTTLTKEYAERLLEGWPPFVNDPPNRSIFNPDDEKRGGWVVALGLIADDAQDDPFFSVYLDCVQYKDRRGHVFWRSMDRVLRILTEIWAKAFAADEFASRAIARTIQALEHIHKYETESGIEQYVSIAMPARHLSVQEKRKIIEHFSGPPLIAASMEQQFRVE